MRENQKPNQPGTTLTDRLRVRFRGIVNHTAQFLVNLGLTPNAATLLGVAGSIAAALFVSMGYMTAGGLILLIMAPLDALDGAMARLMGVDGGFGAFLDSVMDRFAELFVFAGLLYYFSVNDNIYGVLLAFAAAGGSVMVSYTRARGESLGWLTKVGILTRVERYLVLIPALVLSLPFAGVAIIAVLANLTAFQRIFDVRNQSRAEIHDS